VTADATWPERIVQLVLIKQAIAEVDTDHLWPHHLPGVKATEQQLTAVESAIGEALDPKYRVFLSFAGGWPGFLQEIDLFGPDDLLRGPRHDRARELFANLEPSVFEASGVDKDALLPIAASRHDLDLFVVARSKPRAPGVVIWFAPSEVDRFPDFEEFFLAMLDYNRKELESLEAAHGTRRSGVP
jgi:hypothetical protein